MQDIQVSNRHRTQLNRAVNFAHQFCGEALSLEQMARVACMSRHHFCRVFKDYIGENPVAFCSRLKIERAAYLLAFSRDLPILDVAGHCGYSSSQTLSRAFKKRFDFNPRDYRENHVFRLDCADSISEVEQAFELNQAPESIESVDTSMQTGIKIVQQPNLPVAYIRNFGKYGSGGAIPATYELIRKWAHNHHFWNAYNQIIGVGWDCAKITPEALCRFDVCIPVSVNKPIPHEISTQVIPGGLYAVIKANPLSDEVPALWGRFLYLLKRAPSFKRLHLAFDRPFYEASGINEKPGHTSLALYAPVTKHRYS